MLRVTAITKVGDDPDEWRGFAQGRRPVYVRYNSGHLTVNVGAMRTDLATVGDRCAFRRFFEDAPRRLGYRHLKDLTKEVIEWPAYELPETDESAAKLIELHSRERQHELTTSTAKPKPKPLQLKAYIENGRLLVPRGHPNLETLLVNSPDHNCRRMGCTDYAHVLLRR